VPTRDIIVIGGSAGAIDPLMYLFSLLPHRFPAAVFVVVHTSAEHSGALANVLGRAGVMPVELAKDRQPIQQAHAYVAPPDHHLLVGERKMSVVRGARENGFRPAVDPLFYSAARSYGSRVIGVILSGGLDDGNYGLTIIKQHGGLAVVQNPDEALITGMPMSAIKNVEIDHIVRTRELPRLLIDLVGQTVRVTETPNMAKQEPPTTSPTLQPWGADSPQLHGPPSIFTCPECGGTLWELEEGKLLRFRCHTGHSFSMESLVAQQDGKLENALWTAARALQEKAVLRRQLADRVGKQGMTLAAGDYRQQAKDAESKSVLIRQLLESEPFQAAHAKEESKKQPTVRRPRRKERKRSKKSGS
jgi:two-component system, chemotaxis family, protein-glutamate methylesterase/glutaminase